MIEGDIFQYNTTFSNKNGCESEFFESRLSFRPSLFRQVPVFDRFRLVTKSRHRPFRIFWNFEKIFIELGDTAPQSWTNFGNFRKIPDPSTAVVRKSYMGTDQKCSKWFLELKKSVVNFFPPYSQSLGVVWSSYLVGIGLYTNFTGKKFVGWRFQLLVDFFDSFSSAALVGLVQKSSQNLVLDCIWLETLPFFWWPKLQNPRKNI